MSKHFLRVSQKLMPLRVASAGGKYPIVAAATDKDDEGDDDTKKPAAKEYSEFEFTSKFRVLLEELETIRDTENTCECGKYGYR